MKVETWAVVGKVAVGLWIASLLLTVVLFVSGAVVVGSRSRAMRADVGAEVDAAMLALDSARGWA